MVLHDESAEMRVPYVELHNKFCALLDRVADKCRPIIEELVFQDGVKEEVTRVSIASHILNRMASPFINADKLVEAATEVFLDQCVREQMADFPWANVFMIAD
jgi:hypothetical protein